MKMLRLVDALSLLAARLAMILLLVLIGVMSLEVFYRYVLSAPTIWAFDAAFMINGSLFILAAGYALRRDSHIRVDFLSTALPIRLQHALNLGFFMLVLLPVMGALAYVAIDQTLQAYTSGRRELTSAWGPQVWPYYSALAFGLVVLCLQIVAGTVRYGIGLLYPARVAAPGAVHSDENL